MPSPALTTLRTTIATAITDNTKWQTFAFPPATILANSVVVAPDDPYISPQNNSYNVVSFMAHFKIIITVPMLDNQGNLNGIEENIIGVFNLLSASNLDFSISEISAPSVLEAQSGTLLSSEMSISILTSWS